MGGIVLWATRDAHCDASELIENVASEFDRAVRFCAFSELPGLLGSEGVDLLVIELGSDPSGGRTLLETLRRRLPHLAIFAASNDGSVATMRAALDAGATDFLSLPLQAQDFHKAFIKLAQARAAIPAARAMRGDVITVCAARGGIGATTLAVNLAVALAGATRAEVALVDLDLQRGDVATFLNLSPTQSLATLAGAPEDVDDLFLQGLLTRHPSGVFVLPAPAQIDEAEAVGREQVELALRLLRNRFRFVVVDTPRTLTDATLAAIEQSAHVLVLADPSVPGVRAGRRSLDLLTRLDVPRDCIELVFTQAVPGPIPLAEAAKSIGFDPSCTLPHDRHAGEAMNAGTPLPRGRRAKLQPVIAALAARLAGAEGRQGRGWLRRLFGGGE